MDGAQQQPPDDPGRPVMYVHCPAPVPRKDNTLAIVSLGLGAAAWFTQTHFIAAVPAVVIGIVALVRMAKEPEKHDLASGRIMAVMGIFLGVLNVVVIGLAVLLGVGLAILQIALER